MQMIIAESQILAVNSTEMKPSKLRFSIGTLLLTTALIAMLPAYFYFVNKAKLLEQQNISLKSESGFIEVEDANRLYIQELRSPFELTRRFRLQTPSD